MAHFGKLQQYHKCIRREELQNLFSQKRIKLLEVASPSSIEEEVDYQNIDLKTLMHLAQVCQTYEGIEKTFHLRIEHKLEKYLTGIYLNSHEQRCATLILCNLYLMERPLQPSSELTRNIISILEMGKNEVVQNCMTIIFNIACDFPQWKQKAVTQYSLCSLLCQNLRKQDLNRLQIINILRTILKVVRGPFPHESFKEFYPIMVDILGNSASNDNQIIGHAYYCFYNISLQYPKEATSYVINDNLLGRFIKIGPWLKEIKFIIATLHIIRITIEELEKTQIKSKVMPFLKDMMNNGNTIKYSNVKNNIIEVAIKILEDEKISTEEFMKSDIGPILLDLFRTEENPDTLHALVHMFSIVIVNMDFCPLTDDLEKLFQRVELICPQQIETIGFIKETQMKAKQRTLLYN